MTRRLEFNTHGELHISLDAEDANSLLKLSAVLGKPRSSLARDAIRNLLEAHGIKPAECPANRDRA